MIKTFKDSEQILKETREFLLQRYWDNYNKENEYEYDEENYLIRKIWEIIGGKNENNI